MPMPVPQKTSAVLIVNGCYGVVRGRNKVITTEEDTHAGAIE